MKKNLNKRMKSVERRSLEAMTYVGTFEDLDALNAFKDPIVSDSIEIEKIVHFLPEEELSLLLLRDMGYNSQEIAKIMRLKSMGVFYRVRQNLEMHLNLYNILTANSHKELN